MNLLIDGNHLFYRTLFALGDISGNKLLEKKKSHELFMRKVATDTAATIRLFGNPSKIVFTIDSKSWRNNIKMDGGEYKGNRKRDDNKVDWDSFYGLIEEYVDILKKHGFTISKINGAEGDDLLYLWANELLKNKESSVIVTGDKDMHQIIKLKENDYVVVYNNNSKSKKITAPIGFKSWLNVDNYDLFDAESFMNSNKDFFSNLDSSIEIEEISPNRFILTKILMGDSGDDVPSLWVSKVKDRVYGITQTKADRIFDILNIDNNLTDVNQFYDKTKELSNVISSMFNQNVTEENIIQNLNRNIKLLFLDDSIIPNEIQECFKTDFKKSMERKNLAYKNYNVNLLLEGTKYEQNGKAIESDFFKNF